MKGVFRNCGYLAMLLGSMAQADSLLRVMCADEDTDAVVSIDSDAIGNCPTLTAMPPGTYKVRVSKTLSGDREQFFEKQVTLIEGRPQSIDVELSAPQLTASGALAKSRAHAEKIMAKANNGDLEAMNSLASLYDTGEGVDKDPAKAAQWRSRVVKEQFNAQQAEFLKKLQLAQSGDVGAMYTVANLYDSGTGVVKDSGQAAIWRQKAAVKNRDERLENAGFFSEARSYNFSDPGMFSCSTIFVPISILKGVTESPSVTSQQIKIRSEAVMRPSAWGKPDSMIARAALLQESVAAAK